MTVDWTKPIQTSDGRAAWVDEGPDDEGDYRVVFRDAGGPLWFQRDGTCVGDNEYHIVNVPPVEQTVALPAMTLRDWFAGQALASAALPRWACVMAGDVNLVSAYATAAYAMADAMLRAREAKTDTTPEDRARDGETHKLKLALQAIKVVTATAATEKDGLSRIMRIARDAGIVEPFTVLLQDERVALLVSDAPVAERAAVLGRAIAECSLPPQGWHCTRLPGHSGPCAAVPARSSAQTGEVERLREALNDAHGVAACWHDRCAGCATNIKQIRAALYPAKEEG